VHGCECLHQMTCLDTVIAAQVVRQKLGIKMAINDEYARN
jgi:hypothetical protein